MTVHNPRQLRALAILSSGKDAIKRIDPDHYQVRSQHGEGYYDVVFKKCVGWTCTCPNHAEYKNDCKHIYAAHFSAKLRLDVEKEVVPSETLKVRRIVDCPNCHSLDVIKASVRQCKKGAVQRYFCKVCQYRFVVDRELSQLKATPETICAAMDLFFKGVSYGKIRHHLKIQYRLEAERSTIYRWVHKFSGILSKHSEKYKPEVGDLWNSDEMTINIRKKGVKHNLEWIWNLMDADTRYLLASTVSKEREVKDARKVLRQGKDRAGKKPKVLITDGLQSYNEATSKELYDRRDPTIHYRTPSERKYFLNQNMERMNGTVRERTKVMRGLDSRETGQTTLDGQRFYYNHIRPHMSLNGKTPAQAAGVPTPEEGENPWMAYIQTAIREKRNAIAG